MALWNDTTGPTPFRWPLPIGDARAVNADDCSHHARPPKLRDDRLRWLHKADGSDYRYDAQAPS